MQYCKTEEQSSLPREKLKLDLYALASLLVSLQRLKRLILDCVDLFLPPQYSVSDLQRLHCTVEDFSLLEDRERWGLKVDELFTFLTPFTSIRSLTLEYCGFVGERRALSCPRFPHLKNLKLRNNRKMDFFLRVLKGNVVDQDCLPCLEHLEVGKLRWSDLQPLRYLLNRLSDCLSSLTLQFDHEELFNYCACILTVCGTVVHPTQTVPLASLCSRTSHISHSSLRARASPQAGVCGPTSRTSSSRSSTAHPYRRSSGLRSSTWKAARYTTPR